MVRRLLLLLPLVAFVAIALLLWRGLSMDPRIPPSVLIDQPAPGFTLPALDDDGTVDLPPGGLRVVNFFASWCVPCRVEHPQLMAMAADDRVQLVGIAYKDDPEASRTFLAELGNPFTGVGVDADGRAAIDWGVVGVPETFFVDGDGRIRYRHAGPITPEVFEATIRPLLAEFS